jgi:hypothetical protein
MRTILIAVLFSTSVFASYDALLDGPDLLDEPAQITTFYDRDGFTVFYPAGKANEWSVSRTDYGHSRTTLDDVRRAGKVSRDTTRALLNGGSILDAAFPD